MGTNVYSGRATIDPTAPEAFGICQRCGNLWNLRELCYQFQWMGPELQNKNIRVCPDCMDIPSEFLRTLILPPDPEPVLNALPMNFILAEQSYRWLGTENGYILATEDGAWLSTELQSWDD